ncbi:MAG: FIST N-terminal domain-containing protein, partial [Candidatus Eisenbacteria bacterium]
MRWASAGSDSGVLEEAIESVSSAILSEMEGDTIDLAVAFVSRVFSDRYDDFPRLLAERLPHRLLLGCSAAGVIGGGREIERRPGVSVTAARLPEVVLRPARVGPSELPDLDAPPRAWTGLLDTPREPTPHFLVLADPLRFPTPTLLSGLDYAYPKSIKVGGLASGGAAPGANALFIGGEARREGAVVLSLAGGIDVRAVVAQGCRPIGAPLRVTRCR